MCSQVEALCTGVGTSEMRPEFFEKSDLESRMGGRQNFTIWWHKPKPLSSAAAVAAPPAWVPTPVFVVHKWVRVAQSTSATLAPQAASAPKPYSATKMHRPQRPQPRTSSQARPGGAPTHLSLQSSLAKVAPIRPSRTSRLGR